MIGIINNGIETYTIVEELNKNLNNPRIYIADNEKINDLIEKGCIILIDTKNKIKKFENIKVFNIEEIKEENAYYLDNPELITAIKQSNKDKVMEIFENINIEKNKTIVINNPIINYIKSIIEEKYSDNNIIYSVDYLINNIKKYIEINKINLIIDDETYIIN